MFYEDDDDDNDSDNNKMTWGHEDGLARTGLAIMVK
jgi:hypothetical protein